MGSWLPGPRSCSEEWLRFQERVYDFAVGQKLERSEVGNPKASCAARVKRCARYLLNCLQLVWHSARPTHDNAATLYGKRNPTESCEPHCCRYRQEFPRCPRKTDEGCRHDTKDHSSQSMLRCRVLATTLWATSCCGCFLPRHLVLLALLTLCGALFRCHDDVAVLFG